MSVLEPKSAADLLVQDHGTNTYLKTGITGLDKLLGEEYAFRSLLCISTPQPEDTIINRMIATHLHNASTACVTVLDCANAFNIRALSRAIASETATAMQYLRQVNIIKCFDLEGIRDSIDKVRADLESMRTVSMVTSIEASPHLFIIDRLSVLAGIVLKSNPTQGRAILEALFRSLRDLIANHRICIIISDGFSQGEDDECAFDTDSKTRPFFNHITAPTLDLHIHVHRVQETIVTEIAFDRFGGRAGSWCSTI